jgi:hypothetical protein
VPDVAAMFLEETFRPVNQVLEAVGNRSLFSDKNLPVVLWCSAQLQAAPPGVTGDYCTVGGGDYDLASDPSVVPLYDNPPASQVSTSYSSPPTYDIAASSYPETLYDVIPAGNPARPSRNSLCLGRGLLLVNGPDGGVSLYDSATSGLMHLQSLCSFQISERFQKASPCMSLLLRVS